MNMPREKISELIVTISTCFFIPHVHGRHLIEIKPQNSPPGSLASLGDSVWLARPSTVPAQWDLLWKNSRYKSCTGMMSYHHLQ